MASSAAGATIDVFTNTWSYSTIGLVYDSKRGAVWYAHESQSSTRNPTVYEVDRVARTAVFSLALSAVNTGWPWQLDNVTGAGYDFVADTFFLPDYNGDLSYADDNIVEARADGTILNAWEMDDEVGSNDSADGSEIDSIIDIAVVPGSPPRYFATAAYDDNVVYEIVLTRTGTLWTPNSWRTVATYTVPVWPDTDDNLGIDYDAENGRLYHSSWDTTTLVVTNLEMQAVSEISSTFDCPGAGGYNTGVTFLEGSDPPEVWVTDFSSDKTTICEAPSEAPGPMEWSKTVGNTGWTQGLSVTTQTSDTFRVTDVVTADEAYTLTEWWDGEKLLLTDLTVEPPLGRVLTGAGAVTVTGGGGAANEVITITKDFLVLPCTWTETVVSETLVGSETSFDERRAFTVTKKPPVLGISSNNREQVRAGSVATFTLSYSNSGGYENGVVITNTFPISAPFIYANPYPDRVGPDRLSTRWDIGDVAQGAAGMIDVYVYISDTGVITIWDGIYNHVGEVISDVETVFTATAVPPTGWEKTIDGVDWYPGITVTKETSDTLRVVDVIPQGKRFLLAEVWNPTRLILTEHSVYPLAGFTNLYTVSTPFDGGLLFWGTTVAGPVTLTKVFTVGECSWPQTVLLEALEIWDYTDNDYELPVVRPVFVEKEVPELRIDAAPEESTISGGEDVTFTLMYSNVGGYESAFSIVTTFPPEAPFASADPAPDVGATGDLSVTWHFPDGLGSGDSGTITVTASVTDDVPPGTTVPIISAILGHDLVPDDSATVVYSVPPPEWEKWVNGELWTLELSSAAKVGDIITVTDVVSTYSGFVLRETWVPTYFTYMRAVSSAGSLMRSVRINGGEETLSWVAGGEGPGLYTLTKQFRVEAFPVEEEQGFEEGPVEAGEISLLEELVVSGALEERRAVRLALAPSEPVAVGGYSLSRQAATRGRRPSALPLLTLILVLGAASGKARVRGVGSRREDAAH